MDLPADKNDMLHAACHMHVQNKQHSHRILPVGSPSLSYPDRTDIAEIPVKVRLDGNIQYDSTIGIRQRT